VRQETAAAAASERSLGTSDDDAAGYGDDDAADNLRSRATSHVFRLKVLLLLQRILKI
jgi:hypothetical protein